MTMNFSNAGARVRSLLAPGKPAELQTSVLPPAPLRDNIIQEAEARSERFKHALKGRPQVEYDKTHEDGSVTKETYDWSAYDEVLRDAARASFQWDEPEVAGREKIRPSHRLGREVLQSYLGSEGFQELRPYSRGNELEAMCGAMAAGEQLLTDASSHLAEHIARSEQMGEQEQRMQSAEEMFEALRQQAKQEIAEQGAVQPGTRSDIKKNLKAGEQARGMLEGLMQAESQSGMKIDAMAAGASMADDAAEAVEALAAVKGIGGGMAQNLPLDKQLELAEKWQETQNLKDILRMIGRMLRSMTFSRNARTKNVKIQPVGVTNGNDLGLAMPMELARAMSTSPLVRVGFIKDYAERNLLQFDMEGDAPMGKGSFIVVHDGSGSMHGQKFVWATSLCLSSLTIASREHRHFAGVEFGSAGQVKTWDFPARKPPNPDHVLDYATHFFAGGTSTLGGMQEALRILREQPRFKSADVLLIGDGQDIFGAEDKRVRDELRALGARIHGITVMQPRNSYFNAMCDWNTDVQDLAGQNDATSRLAENIS